MSRTKKRWVNQRQQSGWRLCSRSLPAELTRHKVGATVLKLKWINVGGDFMSRLMVTSAV